MMICTSRGGDGCMIIMRIVSDPMGDRRGSTDQEAWRRRERAASTMTVGRVTLREQRARTVKASERVAQDIVRDIVRRGLGTGDRLPLEAAMVEEYGVSRTSLREALRLLEVQGLISLKPGPGGGPVVGTVEPSHLARTASLYFHLSAATYGDVMATQVLMESTCARTAALQPGPRRADGAVARAGPSRRHADATATSPPGSTAPCTRPPPTRCSPC